MSRRRFAGEDGGEKRERRVDVVDVSVGAARRKREDEPRTGRGLLLYSRLRLHWG